MTAGNPTDDTLAAAGDDLRDALHLGNVDRPGPDRAQPTRRRLATRREGPRMILKLGNLNVPQFAEAVGAEFTDEEVAFLEARRSDVADFTDTEAFHIFNDPAISIHVGAAAASGEVLEVFKRANERRLFTREVAFYPQGEAA